MWILVGKRRAELRCFACPGAPGKILGEYNPPIQKMMQAINLCCHSTLAEVIYDYVEENFAAVSRSGKMMFYEYDYNRNIWKEDHFNFYMMISSPHEVIWSQFYKLRLTGEQKLDRDKVLKQLGNMSFRNCVMEAVGRMLIKKWYLVFDLSCWVYHSHDFFFKR
jgi:hypothetical protein